jgi:hypothetical protein
MDRKEFAKKWKTEIALMAKAQDVDMGVGADMLIAHAKQRIELEKTLRYNYEGSGSLNLIEIGKDIIELKKLAATNRKTK